MTLVVTTNINIANISNQTPSSAEHILMSPTVSVAPEVRGAEVVRVVSLRVTLAAGGQRPLARAVLHSAAVIKHASRAQLRPHTCHASLGSPDMSRPRGRSCPGRRRRGRSRSRAASRRTARTWRPRRTWSRPRQPRGRSRSRGGRGAGRCSPGTALFRAVN